MATKRLALELGLVQKRQIKSSITTKIPKAKQEFDYIVVLDFESTCWENGPRMGGQEIIEFPAVLLDLNEGKIVSEFQQYVMPTEQPVLSAFCTNLTGITQEQVDAGVPLGACLYLFSNWIKKLSDEYKISFNTNVQGKHATFATWSDWDLGVCLLYETQRKNLRKPEFFNQWIDIRATYKNFYQRRPQGLAGALKDLGISFEGREHSGICDTRNTATLISRMARDGCVLTITKSLASKSKGLSMKAAAQKIFNQVTSIGKRKSDETQEYSDAKRKQKTVIPKKGSHELGSAQTETNSESQLQNSIIGLKAQSFAMQSVKEQEPLDTISFDLGFQDMCDVPVEDAKVEGKGKKFDENISLYESTQNPSTSCGTFKVPNLALCKLKNIISSKSKKLSDTSCASKEPINTPKLLSYTTFKTPVNYNYKSNSSTYRALSSCGQNSTLNTPLLNETIPNIHGFKKTPPLCECGRRAKLLLTSKPGPNQGRHFYTCPNGKVNMKKFCSFFKWEDEPYIKASPKVGSYITPAVNLNSHLISKSLPPNRSVQRPKALGVRRVFSEVTNNKKYITHRKTHVESTTTSPALCNGNSASESLQITPYIVKSKQMCNNTKNTN